MSYKQELLEILKKRNNVISKELEELIDKSEVAKEPLFIANDCYILIPGNEMSKKTQKISFDTIENMQIELINNYKELEKSERIRLSNQLFSFIVKIFFNGDPSALKAFTGYHGKMSMTDDELSNIKRDYEIAKSKKENKEFLTFFLLDIFPGSNRRADAVVLNNNYDLELYDFSEGVVVEELKKFKGDINELSKSKQKQYLRKKKQKEKNDSFSGKFSPFTEEILDVEIFDDSKGIKYLFIDDFNIYNFNNSYKYFLEHNRQRTFIPLSICFLLNKDDHSDVMVEFPLKTYIDHPHYVNEKKFIDQKYILDIYSNDTKIGLSWIYFNMYFEMFTHFKIILKRREVQYKGKLFEHFGVKDQYGRKKFVYLKDERTGNELPLSLGLIFKHLYSNFNLKTMTVYMSKMCNQNFNYPIIDIEKFHQEIIKNDFDLKMKDLRDLFLE